MTAQVLCIDDDAGVIELVELILQKEGIAVVGASTGTEGLQLMRRIHPQAVLLDIMMPEQDGWSVFKQIKEDAELKDIPVIIVTARDSTFEEVIARDKAGVDDYITKPFTPAALRKSVKKAIATAS